VPPKQKTRLAMREWLFRHGAIEIANCTLDSRFILQGLERLFGRRGVPRLEKRIQLRRFDRLDSFGRMGSAAAGLWRK
jgi:hypothetical protein